MSIKKKNRNIIDRTYVSDQDVIKEEERILVKEFIQGLILGFLAGFLAAYLVLS